MACNLDGNLEIVHIGNDKSSVPYTSPWIEFEGGDAIVIEGGSIFVGRE